MVAARALLSWAEPGLVCATAEPLIEMQLATSHNAARAATAQVKEYFALGLSFKMNRAACRPLFLRFERLVICLTHDLFELFCFASCERDFFDYLDLIEFKVIAVKLE